MLFWPALSEGWMCCSGQHLVRAGCAAQLPALSERWMCCSGQHLVKARCAARWPAINEWPDDWVWSAPDYITLGHLTY